MAARQAKQRNRILTNNSTLKKKRFDARKKEKANLYDIGYNYLTQNFHKFTQTEKIKVSLEVLKIYNQDGEKDLNKFVLCGPVKIDGKQFEVNIGD